MSTVLAKICTKHIRIEYNSTFFKNLSYLYHLGVTQIIALSNNPPIYFQNKSNNIRYDIFIPKLYSNNYYCLIPFDNMAICAKGNYTEEKKAILKNLDKKYLKNYLRKELN